MKFLKDDLKKQNFKRVYLLFGEERYLLNYYTRAFAEKLMDPASELMNKDTFDGKEIPVDRIIDAANTLPFLCEKRLVYVRDSLLFAAGRKDDTESMVDYLPQVPDSTVLVFVETEVEKRNRLYKKVMETGRTVEFSTPTEKELTDWVVNVFKKKGQNIPINNALLLLRTVSHNMEAVYAEADKLSAYAGTRKEIMAEDIEAVCSPSLESRVFDLVAAVGNGKPEKALILYHHMLLLKEQPVMILTMIARQFRLILQCKAYADKKMPASGIAQALELRGFIVDECLRQGKYYTTRCLLEALRDCQDTDLRIKTGLINAETGVETLIIRYAAGSGAY